MSPISPELQLLLNRVLAEVDALRTSVEQMQRQAGEYVQEESFREQIRTMKEDINDLKEQLEIMKKAIIDNQQTNYKRVIAVQAAILSPFVVTVIGYLVKLIFHF